MKCKNCGGYVGQYEDKKSYCMVCGVAVRDFRTKTRPLYFPCSGSCLECEMNISPRDCTNNKRRPRPYDEELPAMSVEWRLREKDMNEIANLLPGAPSWLDYPATRTLLKRMYPGAFQTLY